MKVAETISNAHGSTQIFVLIPNIVFVCSQMKIIFFKNHQMLVKNDRDWVSKVLLNQK